MDIRPNDLIFILIPTIEGHYIIQVEDRQGYVYGSTVAENIRQATDAIVNTIDGNGDNQINIDFGEN